MNSLLFIAEIGLNHNGDINLAKNMISAAKAVGANAVKFQSIKTENLVSKKSLIAKIDGFGFNDVENMGDFWRKVSINYEFHVEIKNYCDKENIEFISTPFDFESLDILEKLGVKRYKIASGDLTHHPLLEYIARKNKPIILSTGMSSIGEIENAVEFIKNNGNEQITLLHCLSLYPTPPELANLNAITVLKNRFKLPVGFSDHTIGYHIPIAAIAKGATIIEKHFTIDNNLPGPDQKLSANPDIFSKMVSCGNEIFEALREKDKIVTDNEVEMRKVARRSIVASKDIKQGIVLKMDDLEFKRPGDGISPDNFQSFIGKRLINSKKKDEKIMWCDIE